MTTEITPIFINGRGDIEMAPGNQITIFNERLETEQLIERIGIAVDGIGAIIDTREATVIDGIKIDGKRQGFVVDGLVTNDNLDGDPKNYLTCALLRPNEVIVRRAGKIGKKSIAALTVKRY